MNHKLLAIEYKGKGSCAMGWWDGRHWNIFGLEGDYSGRIKVTHWMPLPELPPLHKGA